MLKEFERVDETTDYLPVVQQIIAEMNAFVENEKMRVAGIVNNAQMKMAADRARGFVGQKKRYNTGYEQLYIQYHASDDG